MSERTLGIDVSFWQDDNSTPQGVDWKKAKAAGAKFAFIRAGQNTYPDPDFVYNWREAKAAGILRGAYLFYDYRNYPRPQAEFLWQQIQDDPGELPPVMDFERYPTWPLPTRDNCLSVIKTFMAELESLGGRKPIFYSNPSMIIYTLKPIPAWLADHPLWVANYGVSEPMLSATSHWPQGWTFWQYSSTGDGKAFGMESKGLDMNWYNGSEAELRAFAGQGIPPAPVEITDAEKLKRLWEAHPELH
jgi:lysozyme